MNVASAAVRYASTCAAFSKPRCASPRFATLMAGQASGGGDGAPRKDWRSRPNEESPSFAAGQAIGSAAQGFTLGAAPRVAALWFVRRARVGM